PTRSTTPWDAATRSARAPIGDCLPRTLGRALQHEPCCAQVLEGRPDRLEQRHLRGGTPARMASAEEIGEVRADMVSPDCTAFDRLQEILRFLERPSESIDEDFGL